MKATLLASTIAIAMIASATRAAAQDPGGGGAAGKLAAMRAQFEELRRDLFRDQGAFDTRYEGELKKLEDAATGEGKLPLVLAVRTETESFRGRDGGAPEPSAFPRLTRLQKIHAEQTAKLAAARGPKLAALVAGYRKNLEDMQVQLTKDKKIEEAVLVQGELEWLDGEVENLAAAPPKAGPVAGVGGASGGREAGEEMENALGMKLCWIPPGKFTMGSPEGESTRRDDEGQVEVELTRGFWMGKFEVTQGEYESLMGTNPAKFKDVGKGAPVEMVSWAAAVAFCAKLTEAERKKGKLPEGWAYTLPTEAQWEYACRAGEEGPYSGGTLDEVGWYKDNSGGKTHEVGQKKGNAWGLHDVHGNVREWCADWVADTLTGGKDPAGPESGSHRVHRGGGWNGGASFCRAALRGGGTPSLQSLRSYGLGFRVCLSSTK